MDEWITTGQDWTFGCIALKNTDVDEIYPLITPWENEADRKDSQRRREMQMQLVWLDAETLRRGEMQITGKVGRGPACR
jgi:hypothetical protein